MTANSDGRPVAVQHEERTSDMTQVRTAFTPDVVIDVPDAEADQLQAQGLLHSREHGTGPVPENLKPWRAAEGDAVTDAEPTETTTKKKG